MKTREPIGLRFELLYNSAAARIIAGLCLLFSAIDDVLEDLSGSEGMFGIDVHTGIIPFAILHTLRSAPDVIEGFKDLFSVRRGTEE